MNKKIYLTLVAFIMGNGLASDATSMSQKATCSPVQLKFFSNLIQR